MKKEDVFTMWQEFFRYYGIFPKYVRCCVQWHDDQAIGPVNISLEPYDENNVSKEEDEQIAFYCNGIEDFYHLLNEEGEDFTVREIYRFSITL